MKPKTRAIICEHIAVERAESEPGTSDTTNTGKCPHSGKGNPESHGHLQRSIVRNYLGHEESDHGIDALIIVDPYELHASRRRSDKELAAVLAILDELETGNEKPR